MALPRNVGSVQDQRGAVVLPRNVGPVQDQRGVLGKPGYRFQTKLTPTEIDEHRTKNLCFFCHERFNPGHNCPQRQKGEVFVMEIEEAITTQECLVVPEEVKVEEENAVVTLNAVLGNVN